MSLDTRYRPLRFDDVLGQEAAVRILRYYVSHGRGFHQSYLFAGPYGSGKTTLGRILARALLCEAPVEGNPCDQCISCRSIIERGVSDCFVEVDAATNSGKEDITRITEELEYDTFSGKRRIYLFDEAHQLSTSALDALLKPLEENVPGSGDKKLVCIFCTTEPDKMRATILSRCAPSFIIQPLAPAIIADRLAWICQREGFEYDLACLKLIAESAECHIRDCLKAIEGVSMLGPINRENVSVYLHLDQNTLYLDVLDAVGQDLAAALQGVETLLLRASPSTIYQRLTDAAMTAYKMHLGAQKPATFWDLAKIQRLADKADVLLSYASRLATRPARPTGAMLLCDLAMLHHLGSRATEGSQIVVMSQASQVPGPIKATKPNELPEKSIVSGEKAASNGKIALVGEVSGEKPDHEVYVDPRAVRRKAEGDRGTPGKLLSSNDTLPPDEFCRLLGLRLAELGGGSAHGLAGRHHLDRSGAIEPGRAEGRGGGA